ncbi:MAG TPA: hypothetical protein VGF24_20835 [Vicinamibacterales bacterium]
MLRAGSVVAIVAAGMVLLSFEVSLSWRELLRLTIDEINDDDCL